MFYIFLAILIFVYLPSRWSNGATLWESIAPNEPIMATIWIIILLVIFYLVVAKFGEDHDNKKTAVNRGLVNKSATVKEAKEALRIAEVDKQNRIFRRNQRWQYCDKVMDLIRNRVDNFYKYKFISDEEKEIAMRVLRGRGKELEEIEIEIRKEKGVTIQQFDYFALSREMRKTPDYNDYTDVFEKLGLGFLEGGIQYGGCTVKLVRNEKIIKEVVLNKYGLVLGTKEECEKMYGIKFE